MIMDTSNSRSLRIFIGKMGARTAYCLVLLRTVNEIQLGNSISGLTRVVLVYANYSDIVSKSALELQNVLV